MIASELPRSVPCRCVQGGEHIPTGALCEKYGGWVTWAREGRCGKVAFPMLKGYKFRIDSDHLRIRGLIYGIKSKTALERAKK